MAPSGRSVGFNPGVAPAGALTPALVQALTALLATQGAGLGNFLRGLGGAVKQGILEMKHMVILIFNQCMIRFWRSLAYQELHVLESFSAHDKLCTKLGEYFKPMSRIGHLVNDGEIILLRISAGYMCQISIGWQMMCYLMENT
ncbi:uncharacterized protein LOC141719784 isoform X1 [Apium graveolens]|uniref:uncharacterized protein LOC141719784 isoform X1 n=1 Tax=Apium graveolens TaxID=4045 RepID=UPI003D79E878